MGLYPLAMWVRFTDKDTDRHGVCSPANQEPSCPGSMQSGVCPNTTKQRLQRLRIAFDRVAAIDVHNQGFAKGRAV